VRLPIADCGFGIADLGMFDDFYEFYDLNGFNGFNGFNDFNHCNELANYLIN
jgi:hypothetical protein